MHGLIQWWGGFKWYLTSSECGSSYRNVCVCDNGHDCYVFVLAFCQFSHSLVHMYNIYVKRIQQVRNYCLRLLWLLMQKLWYHWKKSEISLNFADKEMSRTGKFPEQEACTLLYHPFQEVLPCPWHFLISKSSGNFNFLQMYGTLMTNEFS